MSFPVADESSVLVLVASGRPGSGRPGRDVIASDKRVRDLMGQRWLRRDLLSEMGHL